MLVNTSWYRRLSKTHTGFSVMPPRWILELGNCDWAWVHQSRHGYYHMFGHMTGSWLGVLVVQAWELIRMLGYKEECTRPGTPCMCWDPKCSGKILDQHNLVLTMQSWPGGLWIDQGIGLEGLILKKHIVGGEWFFGGLPTRPLYL